MKHLRNIVLALAVIICGSTSAANAEKWSCEEEIDGKMYKQEWIVSDDKMHAAKGKGYFQVVRNDNDILFAFFRFFEKDPKTGRLINKPKNIYVVIVKKTGIGIEFDDMAADVNFGPETEQWVPPAVDIRHCSLEQP
jgi:hypothetical protein